MGSTTHTFPDLEVRGKTYVYTRQQEHHLRSLLQLLAEFDNICEQHEIEYTICDSTLLGAIRHEGFIPWVREVEVDVRVEDVERLQEHLPLKPTRRGYRWKSGGVTLEILASTYSLSDGSYSNGCTYDEIHPRSRYPFESITLWGPQNGQMIARRRYGPDCLHVAVVKEKDWLSWLRR